eukprot:scaffold7804_cov65-Phaeocystis_antarctica.AAC.9
MLLSLASAWPAGWSAPCCRATVAPRASVRLQFGKFGAGSQFTERPMENINRAGPSEDRVAHIRDLVGKMQASGKIGAAGAALAAQRDEIASKPKSDKAIEEEHRADIEVAQKCAADMTSSGDTKGAVKALQAVQPYLCTVTELGSAVLLDLAMALDSQRDPEARTIFASLSRSPTKEVRQMAQMMAGLDESEDFLKL